MISKMERAYILQEGKPYYVFNEKKYYGIFNRGILQHVILLEWF